MRTDDIFAAAFEIGFRSMNGIGSLSG